MGDLADNFEEWRHDEDTRALSQKGIAEQNAHLLRRYRDFRLAADAIAAVWTRQADVRAIALVGSTAVAPYKQVPRLQPYRRAGIELWHECKDVDLALWLDKLDDLDALRRAKVRALSDLAGRTSAGVADHQADVFILAPGSNRYLGRLCDFNQCPKGKRECLAPGCGATPFLQQHQDFDWRPDTIAPERMLFLFDRDSGQFIRAADLPLPEVT